MAARAEPEVVKGSIGGSLIEFSREAQEEPNENIVFADTPAHCSCPHCDRTVVTFIDYEASWVTYLLGIVVWFSLGWMAFWVLPLLWPAFKDVVHHCPRCLNVVARTSRIKLPTFRSEVMSLKVGSCAVVLARKYVMILCGLVAVIVTVAIVRSTVHISPGQASRESMPRGPPSQLTWEDFLHECGPRTSLGHRTSSVRKFEEHFRRRTFKWQGEVLLIREGFDVFFLHAKSVVMVRMHPPRYPRRDIPDIALLFSDDKNAEVGELTKGGWIEFEATMTAHGHRGDPEVMSLWHVKQVPRPEGVVPNPVATELEDKFATFEGVPNQAELPEDLMKEDGEKVAQQAAAQEAAEKATEQATEKATLAPAAQEETAAPVEAAAAQPASTGPPKPDPAVGEVAKEVPTAATDAAKVADKPAEAGKPAAEAEKPAAATTDGAAVKAEVPAADATIAAATVA